MSLVDTPPPPLAPLSPEVVDVDASVAEAAPELIDKVAPVANGADAIATETGEALGAADGSAAATATSAAPADNSDPVPEPTTENKENGAVVKDRGVRKVLQSGVFGGQCSLPPS